MTFQMTLGLGMGALCVLMWGSWHKRPWLVAAGKTLASLAFVWAASHAPTSASYYGTRVMGATSLALIGDVLLLSEARAAFIAALLAFLLGHLCYIDAFLHQGFHAAWLGTAMMGLMIPSGYVQLRLWPKLDLGFKVPVLTYLLVITLMLASSLAALPHSVAPKLQVFGSTLFYLSDLCVAREAFVVKSRINKMLGLPLYYAAQWLLVATLGG